MIPVLGQALIGEQYWRYMIIPLILVKRQGAVWGF